MADKKGITAIMFIVLFGVAVIMMAFLFLVFFKLHVTYFSTDQLNINSYSTFLSTILPLYIPEEDTIMTFVINKVNNFAGFDYNLNKESSLKEFVKQALPGSCYKFEINTDKSKILFEKTTDFDPSSIGVDISGYTCDKTKIKLKSTISVPVIENGEPTTKNAELTIYGVKELRLPNVGAVLTSTIAWPVVVRK